MWLSVDEVVQLGRARRKVLVNIASGKWESRDSGVGRNGKPTRQVLLTSLPRELQQRYAERLKAESTPQDLEAVSDAAKFSSAANSEVDGSVLLELRLNEALKRFPFEVREAMLNEARRLVGIVERYNAIAVKRRRATVDGSPARLEFVPEVLALCKEATCTDQIILDYYKSRQHSIRKGNEPARAQCPSPYTLDGWSRRLKSDGLLTFLRSSNDGNHREPSSRNDRRRAIIDAEAIEWVNKHYRNYATPRDLFYNLQKRARKNNWTIPSESWAYRYWKNLPKIVRVTLEKGQKAYVSQCAPYVPRDNRDLEALQILCGDHSERDVTVRLKDGSLARPWLTTWFDLRTGLIWGWHLDLTPSSRTAGLAYANGVRTFGAQPLSRPEDGFWSYIYTDQGKDYKSHNISGKTLVFNRAMAIEGGLECLRVQRRVGLIDDMGLKQLLARGYNAREKPVERLHRDISTWEQRTFETEYCGRDAKTKPDRWREAFARHTKLEKRARRGNSLLLEDSPFMAIDDYREALAGWMYEYNSTAHERTALGSAKIVPLEEYERLYTTRYEISEEALALFLMKAERRKVSKNGVWMFQRHWWFLHPQLALYKGQDVEVRYTDSDYSQIWIVTPDGKSILQAQLITPTGQLNPNKQTLSLIKEQSARERKIIRDFNFITQSQIRGESVEERVAALIEPEEEVEAIAAAVNDGGAAYSPARVQQLTRMDRPKLLRTPPALLTSASAVESTEADEGIFSDEESGRGRVIEFDYEDD